MRLTVFLAAMLSLSSCIPFRRAKVPPPPTGPIPVRIPDQVAAGNTAPKTMPSPPAVETPTPDGKAPAEKAVGLPAPPVAASAPAARPRRARVRKPAVVEAPAETSVAESAPDPTAPPFRLGELRTPQEKENLRQRVEQMLNRCSAAITAAEGRSLNSTQTEMLQRVRTFALQAREKMDADPGEARNLAAKGRTFADALLAELK